MVFKAIYRDPEGKKVVFFAEKPTAQEAVTHIEHEIALRAAGSPEDFGGLVFRRIEHEGARTYLSLHEDDVQAAVRALDRLSRMTDKTAVLCVKA